MFLNLWRDHDPEDDSLTFAAVSSPNHGTLSGTVPNLLYAPDDDFNGSNSFTFESEAVTVNITIVPVNDLPEELDKKALEDHGLVKVADNSIITGTLLKSGIDVDGNLLTMSLVSDVKHGNLCLNDDGTFTYTPDSNFSDTDQFI